MKIRAVITGAVTAILVSAATTASALAQEFEKVENAAREQLPAPKFVGAAYAFIWLAILGYVVFVARNLAKTRTEIEDLKRRIERAGGAPGAGAGAGGRGGGAG
jgi:CcmD family protein